MSDQPEALRVAQALEVKHSPGVVLTFETVLDAVRLLREQHAEIERLRGAPQPEPAAMFDERVGHPVLLPGAPMFEDGQFLYATTPAAAPDEMEALRAEIERFYDKLDYTKKGLAEWREEALRHMQQAKAAQATARVAICHLRAVLAECAYDPVRVEEARDWLVSIGAAAIDAAMGGNP
jgi:hypothetical protein